MPDPPMIPKTAFVMIIPLDYPPWIISLAAPCRIRPRPLWPEHSRWSRQVQDREVRGLGRAPPSTRKRPRRGLVLRSVVGHRRGGVSLDLAAHPGPDLLLGE